jgi:subtilisin family serine protease
MRRTLLTLVLALAVAAAALPAAAASPRLAPLHAAAGETIEGEYLVVLQDGRSATAVAAQVGITPTSDFGQALDGFSATLDSHQLERVRRHPHVRFVEENQVVTANSTQVNPPWGLDRIDQPLLPLDNLYHWYASASEIHAYIFDTGIQYTHPEFGGRAFFSYDAFGGTGNDCHGHGTHVAGTVGAKTYGVAKDVNLWSVRVLNCAGSGSWAGIINAINYVIANHKRPAVANFSLGGGYSAAVNAAIDSLVNARIFTAVAAGNSAANACSFSPASASLAYTVAASTINDQHAWFSNYGQCVNIYAPGVDVTSTWIGSSTNTISGTSMASPHVAGTAALYLAYGFQPPAATANFLTTTATPGVLSGVPPGTPNLLLFKGGL